MEKNKMKLWEESENDLNQMAKVSVHTITEFLHSGEEKTSSRVKAALLAFAGYTRLIQAQNGQQRVILSALVYCNLQDPKERKRYIQTTMPQLNLARK